VVRGDRKKMSGETTGTWTHTVSGPPMLLVFCPCGIAHTVDNAIDGGMSVVDCPCGMACEIQHYGIGKDEHLDGAAV
jgi:hypothetical protein